MLQVFITYNAHHCFSLALVSRSLFLFRHSCLSYFFILFLSAFCEFIDFLSRFPPAISSCPRFDNIYIRVYDAREKFKLSLDIVNVVLFLSRKEWTDIGKSAQISLWRFKCLVSFLTNFELTLARHSRYISHKISRSANSLCDFFPFYVTHK